MIRLKKMKVLLYVSLALFTTYEENKTSHTHKMSYKKRKIATNELILPASSAARPTFELSNVSKLHCIFFF